MRQMKSRCFSFREGTIGWQRVTGSQYLLVCSFLDIICQLILASLSMSKKTIWIFYSKKVYLLNLF